MADNVRTSKGRLHCELWGWAPRNRADFGDISIHQIDWDPRDCTWHLLQGPLQHLALGKGDTDKLPYICQFDNPPGLIESDFALLQGYRNFSGARFDNCPSERSAACNSLYCALGGILPVSYQWRLAMWFQSPEDTAAPGGRLYLHDQNRRASLSRSHF